MAKRSAFKVSRKTLRNLKKRLDSYLDPARKPRVTDLKFFAAAKLCAVLERLAQQERALDITAERMLGSNNQEHPLMQALEEIRLEDEAARQAQEQLQREREGNGEATLPPDRGADSAAAASALTKPAAVASAGLP